MAKDYSEIIRFIKKQFPDLDSIPLHAPLFCGNEKKYLNNTIDSTFVSSVGEFVNDFESGIAKYTGAKYAVATVNCTNALHIALLTCGVKRGDEVLSQALSFVATSNAIAYAGGVPVYIDVDSDTLGMSPVSLNSFLNKFAIKRKDGFTYNKLSGKKISACIPMHTFGLPLRIDEISSICSFWNIDLIEDAAESLGSYYKGKHTGTFGKMGTFSFNGNKIITCGGGGAIITDDEEIAILAKHLTTQAKLPHFWKFYHDAVGYNYRMPNLNAALGCAQLELLDGFVESKRDLNKRYSIFFKSERIETLNEIEGAKSNYWLNGIVFDSVVSKDQFLELSNKSGVMTRPIWELMNTLPMFKNCLNDGLVNSKWLVERVVNIPSSVRVGR